MMIDTANTKEKFAFGSQYIRTYGLKNMKDIS